MMRSAAKLSYQEAQAAIDGQPGRSDAAAAGDGAASRCGRPTPRWRQARDKRAPLDLDLPERKIVLDEQGASQRRRAASALAAHRLIEEMMIQANVAAAETLEAQATPLIYRIHDSPRAGEARRACATSCRRWA